MKKKFLIPVAVFLLIIVGLFIVFFVRDAYNEDGKEPITFGEDLASTVKMNAESAFSFLNTDTKQLPDNMRGYFVDPETDINVSDKSTESLKKSVEGVFEKVNAIKPNTIAVKIDAGKSYDYGGTDIVKYLVEQAHEKDLFVLLSLSSASNDAEKLVSLAEKFGADGVMPDFDTTDIGKINITDIRNTLNEKKIFFGIALNEKLDDTVRKEIESGSADFYFAKIDSSTETGAQSIVADWTACALKTKAKVYARLRNDLVKSGIGYTKENEINEQLRLLYNYGGFSGALMTSREKLASDDNDTATNLYSYYEYFNNAEYTALTLTDFEIKNKESVVFSGTSDRDYPIYVWSTVTDAWQNVDNTKENGAFTAKLSLRTGTNKLIVRHKSAMYIYYIDKVTDVMTSADAQIADGKVILTATAVKGSDVYASIANTIPVQLTPTGQESADYAQYLAEYTLNDNLSVLKEDQISFAAAYNGLCDMVMCGEEKSPTPYDDHGLGTADMLIVTKDYAETTSTVAEDDSSDPTCTPQLASATACVDKYSVSDNHVIFSSTGGMKIYADDSRLLLNGYIMPNNSVTLNSVSQNNGTLLKFSVDYPTFTKILVEPQTYYKGYLDRIYNIDSFESEYVDVMFMDTSVCLMNENIDFAASEMIDRCEWYTNTDEKFITLRLYLKNKGVFGGYALTMDENGDIELLIKNKRKALSGSVIMLDPGHGGYGSPGTNADMTIYEKELTLSIAQKAAAMLREHGATVILTREADDAVFIDERVALARSVRPDVFVSIHCDGSDSTSWLGTHSFYYKNYSMPLADAVHKQLVKAYRSYYYTDPNSDAYTTVDKGIKFFPYQVARIEECPSVLVECGYLTNENDARFLSDENGQKIIATALAQGIVDYIEKN